MTTPNSILSRVCSDLNEDEKQRFDSVNYLGIVCASVLLKKGLSPYYVTNITDDWVPMTAVIEMTTIVDPEELGGKSLVYLPKVRAFRSRTVSTSPTKRFEESFLSALDRMYP